ncbi:hypothetical protein EMIHUDRAFT_124658, partial [Emiliania huxleyi CCMP1516]|uniref:Uncharacterized protein n=2 Tax=Emiliania huxleyi TaxID=2903 RepID=A0A0D3IJR4_EMIH1
TSDSINNMSENKTEVKARIIPAENAPALKPVTEDAPALEPGDADWNVSTKEFPEKEPAPSGIDEWKTPSPLRKIERKGESNLVDRSNKTTKIPTPIGRVDSNGFAALLGTDVDEEDLAGVGSAGKKGLFAAREGRSEGVVRRG